jgi:hypothetical protein
MQAYLLDQSFELQTDNTRLQWLLQQCHISHHQECWLNLNLLAVSTSAGPLPA